MKQFELWLADLKPQVGAEPGKIRPVLIVQTNSLNDVKHPSTIVCPLTTNVKTGTAPLRTLIKKNDSLLREDSDIMIDQIRAIDNHRFIRKIGTLPNHLIRMVKQNIIHVLDLEDDK